MVLVTDNKDHLAETLSWNTGARISALEGVAQETKKTNDQADKNNKEIYGKTFKVYLYPHDDTRRDYVFFNLIIDIEHKDEPEKTVIKAILTLVYI